jgi:hypothetical protein
MKNEQLLKQLDTMAQAFTMDDAQIDMNNLACKLHTLLENKLGVLNVNGEQKEVLTKMAKLAVRLAK